MNNRREARGVGRGARARVSGDGEWAMRHAGLPWRREFPNRPCGKKFETIWIMTPR